MNTKVNLNINQVSEKQLAAYTFDKTTLLNLHASNQLPLDYHIVWLRYYISKYSLLRKDITAFIEFLANNPSSVQFAIKCLSSSERKRLVRYLHTLRNYLPSCRILFYLANNLELLGYDMHNLIYWMDLKLNPVPLYSKKGFVTRNWAVLQLRLRDFKPNLGVWTIQRTINYKSYLACKLDRFYYKGDFTADSIHCMYDGDPKLFHLPMTYFDHSFYSLTYFLNKVSSKVKDINLKNKISSCCGYKLELNTYWDSSYVDKVMFTYDQTFHNSIDLLKQNIRDVNHYLSNTAKVFTPDIDIS